VEAKEAGIDRFRKHNVHATDWGDRIEGKPIYQNETIIASESLGRNVLRKRGPSGVTKLKCQ
jgi:hypothetical protein